MKIQHSTLVAFFVLWYGLFAQAGTPPGNSQKNRISVQESGSNELSVITPSGKAVVSIETIVVEGSCLKACPASNALTETGGKRASLVQRLSISIAGKPVAVPPFVYAALFNVQRASLEYRGGIFLLGLSEGTDEYVINIYFSPKNGITRMTIYDGVAATLVEDAKIHQAVFE